MKRLFLPIAIIFTYGCLLLDTIKYPGFVGNHFLIDSRIYFAVVIVLLFIMESKSRILNFVLRINSAVLLLSAGVYLIFAIIEGIHFPNYVLATYHFHPDGLIYVVLFNVSIFLITKLNLNLKKPFQLKNLGYLILIFLTTYTLIASVGLSMQKAFAGDFYAAGHVTNSYDEKMYFQWHDFYNYMLFVKYSTPENANVVIPPEIAPWWTRSGNLYLVRSFLYPRNTIQYDSEKIPDLNALPTDTYIMVAWGEWGCDIGLCKVWPQETIKAKEAIFMDRKSPNIQDIKENFKYDPKDTSTPFGLLKL